MLVKLNRIVVPTHREVEVQAGSSIVLKTDLDGRITHASRDLQRISGYRDTDLVGSFESLLRHPEMPDEVYADLWRDVVKGRPWSAALKCVARNGDHFWMVADVVPVEQRGRVAGFMWSGRRALRYEIDRADLGYRRLRDKAPGGPVMLHGRVVSNPRLGQVSAWYRDQSVAGKMLLHGALAALVVIALGVAGGPRLGMPGNALGDPDNAGLTLEMVGAFILFAAVVVFVTSRLVSRPLQEANRAIRMMAEGNFHERVSSHRNDEVGRLLQNVRKLQIRMGYDIERMVIGGVQGQSVHTFDARLHPHADSAQGAMERRSIDAGVRGDQGGAVNGREAGPGAGAGAGAGGGWMPPLSAARNEPFVPACAADEDTLVASATEQPMVVREAPQSGVGTAVLVGELVLERDARFGPMTDRDAADLDVDVAVDGNRHHAARVLHARTRQKVAQPLPKVKRGKQANLQDEWNSL